VQDRDLSAIRELRQAAGHRERLQDGHVAAQRERSWTRHHPRHVDAAPVDVVDDHRHARIADERRELVLHHFLELRGRQPLRDDVADERKRDLPIRPDRNGPRQLRLLPDGDLDHVFLGEPELLDLLHLVGMRLCVVRASGPEHRERRRGTPQPLRAQGHNPSSAAAGQAGLGGVAGARAVPARTPAGGRPARLLCSHSDGRTSERPCAS
jgi:hypothetical protein